MSSSDTKPIVSGPSPESIPSDGNAKTIAGFRHLVSTAFGRTWTWIKKHPSWFPIVSTFTGTATALLYSIIAMVSLVATLCGVIGGAAASIIPSEVSAREMRRKSIVWISISHNLFATSLRLALRGAVSALPILGNGTIILCDLYNHKKEENLFCLVEEASHAKAN